MFSTAVSMPETTCKINKMPGPTSGARICFNLESAVKQVGAIVTPYQIPFKMDVPATDLEMLPLHQKPSNFPPRFFNQAGQRGTRDFHLNSSFKMLHAQVINQPNRFKLI
jgi:hypothetical protein